MPKGREELRRGVRDLIEVTSREMEALSDKAAPQSPAPDEASADQPDRPILRLVREPRVRPQPLPEPEAIPAVISTPGGLPAPSPAVAPSPVVLPDVAGVHPRRGVCAAYHINPRCWDVEDAFCNHALHVCMLRDCPVYNLNREEMEKRFSAKFAHLW